MLVQYTPLSSLSEAEKSRLKLVLYRMVLEGRLYIDFEGKYLAVNDLLEQRQAWQQADNEAHRKILFG